MSFLFGDLSEAPLTTNFLEELRDAIDFTGAIADADQHITTAEATTDGLRRRAEDDVAMQAALVRSMLAAADAAEKGAADGITARLVSELAQIMEERRAVAEAAVRSKLADDIRALDAATLAAREDYFPTLEEYLLAREPPATRQTIRVELVGAGKKDPHRYVAESSGQSDIGLAWTIEMAVPEEGLWSGPVRVDRVAEDLSIVAPSRSGLIKKDVKLKKQRLDRHLVTSIVEAGAVFRVDLREDLGQAEGFVVEADLDRRSVSLAKSGEEDDPTVGPFEVAVEDEPALLDFASKLRAMVRELSKKRLAAATFDGLPFDGTNSDVQPKLVEVVSRLVEKLAPIVVEIGARSRSADELVLRRMLADGRREELFLPKARVRERLATLDTAHKDLFAALASAIDASPAPPVPQVHVPEPAPSIRSEVPPSVPGPVRRRSGNMAAVVVEKPPAPVELEVEVEVELPRPKAPSLASTLEHIRAIANEEQPHEVFRQFSTLFATSMFSSCGHEVQRKALRLMIFGTASPSPSDEMRAAHRAALPFVQALVLEQRDAADYEMLGMTYLALEEPEKATEMFRKALEIERARNPASELCGSLMRRVNEV